MIDLIRRFDCHEMTKTTLAGQMAVLKLIEELEQKGFNVISADTGHVVIDESTEFLSFTPAPMPAPWRIEAKATPFSPWIIVEPTVHRLERAISHADELKKTWRYYATRIRAN